MDEHVLLQLAALMMLGIGATWLAALVRLPSILLLLLVGFLAGPVLGWLEPDTIFGETLFSIVSLAVALILFEGGLQLKIRRIRETRVAVLDLVLIGSAVTLILVTLLARYLLGLDAALSLLIGALLVVTGPTVIMPMLRTIRPTGRVGPVIRWEGIINDPLGALLAFMVFEWIRTGQGADGLGIHVGRLLLSMAAGGTVGIVGALLFMTLMARYWVPDHLQNPFALMLVIAAYTGANALMPESGLLAVTLMGIVLANQHRISLHHMVAFQEDVRVVLIGFLFVALSARMDLQVFRELGWEAIAFLALLILVVRPAAVFLSTFGSRLTVPEKTLLAWMAPRGIVAAAVASVFALRLRELDIAGSETFLPIVFLVIVGTVAVYGLTAKPLACALGLAPRGREGVLFVGANPLARELACALNQVGIQTRLVSEREDDLAAAQAQGLTAFSASFLDRRSLEELDLATTGHMVALCTSDEHNLLAILQWEELFGRSHVYHPLHEDLATPSASTYRLEGRLLGHPPLPYQDLLSRYHEGARATVLPIDTTYPLPLPSDRFPSSTWPVFVVGPGPTLTVVTRRTLQLHPGQILIALVSSDHSQPSIVP